MSSLGVDIGTTKMKTSSERIYPSGISENIYLSNNIMEVEGKKYAMGLQYSKSIFDVNIDKSMNRNSRLNYIYVLHQESEEVDPYYENVVTALPCSQWKNNNTVEKFRNYLSIGDGLSVIVNGFEKHITVENIDIVPEGSTAYYTNEMDYERFEGRKVLLLDWGGLTLNQILFLDDQVIDLHTDEFGVLKIYKEMADKITSDTGIDAKIEDILDILQYGLFDNGNTIDVSEIVKPIALAYCNQIHRELKLRWSINNIPFVPMIGGGSITMHNYFIEYVHHAELIEKAQTLAAIGMQE